VDPLVDLNEEQFSIPEDLAVKLKKRAEDKGFNSLSDYVTYVLRQVLSRIETDEKQAKPQSEKEDKEEIKQKLRDLGYLD
jgi:Arc/MetJ-type ribon-helix-helix transcriptional regulator